MKTLYSFFLLPILFIAQYSVPLETDPPGEFCASDAVLQQSLGTQGPGAIAQFEQSVALALQTESAMPYTLPVVVHIIHDSGPENLPDATVLQGIDDLNAAFANSGYYDQGTGLDTELSFCLAKRDPDGNATTGINHVQSTLTELFLETQDLDLKDLIRWDPTQYINIWVVREICSLSAGCGVAGYAYFPTSAGMDEDGIVMEANYFGSSPANSSVLVHEMGHYLGLYHTFEGGCTNNDCTTDGDRVCDTPPDQSTAQVTCGNSVNTCSTDTNSGFATDQNDMYWNYMDYGDLDCYSAFTPGQSNRMQAVVETVRFSLTESEACLDPCTSLITAGFSTASTEVPIGTTLSFTNTTLNADSYNWLIDGVSFANSIDASYLFGTLGTFTIALEALNDDPNCIGTFELDIDVFCPVEAAFIGSNYSPLAGENVLFENLSSNADNFEWQLNGIPVSTAMQLDTNFIVPGAYLLCLTADNGLCTNEYCQYIFVSAPDPDCAESAELIVFGAPDIDEELYCMRTLVNGNVILGGRLDDQCLLAEVSPDLQIQWARTFNFSVYDEYLTEIYEDSEGYLLCSGYSEIVNDFRDVFIFKFDPAANTLLWHKDLAVTVNQNRSILNRILEPPAGQPQDQYWVFGQVWPTTFSANCDATYMTVDRNTGAQLSLINYDLGSCETFKDVQLVNDAIYVTGRYNNAGGGSNQMRAALSQLYYDGSVDWSKLYLTPTPGANARCYPKILLHRNDQLYVYGNGDLDGTSVTDVELFLFQTDLDGNLQFAQIYNFTGNNNEEAFQMLELPDGFLLSGDYSNGNQQEAFLLKVDFNGQLLWSKSIGNTGHEFSQTLTLVGDQIWLSGSTSTFSGSSDIFLVQLDLDGNIDSDNCDFVQDLAVDAFPLANPFEGPVALELFTPNNPLIDNDLTDSAADLPVQEYCPTNCEEICNNGIDDDQDGFIDCYDDECACTLECEDFYWNDCPDNCVGTPLTGDFSIQQLWESENQVCNWALPVVGDLDGDGIPEVVSGRSDGPGYAFDGQTGQTKYLYSAAGLSAGSAYTAIANLDGDPQGEVIFWQDTELKVFEHDGVLKWAVPNPMPNPARIPGVYDFNEDGIPEISFGPYIFSSLDGTLLLEATGANGTNPNYSPIGLVVAADLLSENDCGSPICQGLELAAGPDVYAVTLVSYTNPALNSITLVRQLPGFGDGYTSIADFDADGKLDIIVGGTNLNSNTSGVYVWDPVTEQLSQPFWTLGNASLTIGRPTVADFDNDGALEIAVHTEDFSGGDLQVIDQDMSTLWSFSTNDASGATGCTAFDFNGDGAAEVVYRDQSQLQIIEGSTGLIIASFPCTSGTINEYPVIADLNGDGQTEIACNCGGTPANVNVAHTTVWGSADLPWMPARPVWNQHAYFNVNIFDDLTIPQEQQQPHLPGNNTLNSFLTQYSNPEYPVPDATLEVLSAGCGGDSLHFTVQICNIGEQVLSFNTPISIWAGNPTLSAAADLLSSNSTLGQTLPKDSCIILELQLPITAGDFTLIVNDNGSLNPVFDLDVDFPNTPISECDYSNNIDQFTFEYTPPLLDLGPDIASCSTIVNTLDAGPGFEQYEWQDGNTGQTYTTWGPGLYWVTVTDSCGNMFSDTLQITVDPTTVLDLGPDQVYCQNSSITLSVTGFDNYQWSPTVFLDCDTCATVLINPDSTTCYTLTATTAEGCQSVDSIKIFVSMPATTLDTNYLCEGESLIVFGTAISDPGIYSETYSGTAGCDSTSIIEVIGLDTVLSTEFRQICENESTVIFGSPTNTPGEYFEVYPAANGCDSTHLITLEVLDTILVQEQVQICMGDSVLLFGDYISSPGQYSETYSNQANCDSTQLIVLSWYPVGVPEVTVTPICQGSTPGMIEVQITGGSPPFNYQWNAPGGIGNILTTDVPGTYTVTITDSNGCLTSLTATLEETAAPDIQLMPFPAGCFDLAGGSLEILNAGTGLDFSLDGLNFTTNTSFEQLAPGSYTLTAADPNGCLFEFDFFIGSPPELILSLPEYLQIELGESILINGQSNSLDVQTYLWTPSENLDCLDCLDPLAAPTETTLYTLTISDSNGCTDSAQTLIEVLPNYEIYIPNAFSPDFDGINDGFTIYAGTNVAAIQELLIFDRWGELIFRNTNFSPNDPTLGWDGRFRGEQMDAGIFVYLTRVRFVNDRVEIFKGDVFLLR